MEKYNYDKIDELIEKAYWLIDIFPEQVKADSEGQFFPIEQYFLKHSNIERVYQKFINILLKLNCYYDFQVSYIVEDGWIKNPPPETLTQWIFQCISHECGKREYMNIIIESENSMMIVNGDDLYMALYNPSNKLKSLVETFAGAEGLFVWKPCLLP